MSSDDIATTDDPFLLHWGTSVDVNDDLRRTIRTEIESIEKSTSLLSSNVKNEERTATQLHKDLYRAKSEMLDFRRGGGDLLDGALVNDEVLGRLTEEFRGEVAVHVVSPGGSPNSNHGHGGSDDEDMDDEQGFDGVSVANPANGMMEDGNGRISNRGNSSGGGKKAYSHAKFIVQKRNEAKTKSNSLQTLQREIEQTRKKINSTNDETANILQVIQSRQLDATKVTGERQVDARRREFEAESMRNRGVKEAIQAARANSGSFAQKIAEKAKEQISERSSNVSQESSLSSTIDAKQQELALLSAQEKKLDTELATLSGQLDFLIQQLTDAESEVKKSNSIKSEMEVVNVEVEEFKTAHEAVSQKANASEKELEAARSKLQEATKQAEEVQSQKLANDKAQIEVLEPALERKAKATKDKETLAGKIASLHKNMMEMEESRRSSISASETKLNTLSTNLASKKESLEKSKAELEQLQAQFTQEETARTKELQEVKSFSSQFEEATKAEVSRLEDLKRQRIDARVEALDKRRSELALLEDGRMKNNDYLRQGLEFVRDMREVESAIREAEVEIDANGEEVCTLPEFVVGFLNENCEAMDDLKVGGDGAGDGVGASTGNCGGEGGELSTEVVDASRTCIEVGGEGTQESKPGDCNEERPSQGGKMNDRDDMVTEAASSPAAKRR